MFQWWWSGNIKTKKTNFGCQGAYDVKTFCGIVLLYDQNVHRWGKPKDSYHEVQVKSLSFVSKVPKTLQCCSAKHHREVVLVRAPEQLLVRYVGVGVCLGPTGNRTQTHQNQNHAGQRKHVGTNGDLSSKRRLQFGVCGSKDLKWLTGSRTLPESVGKLVRLHSWTHCERKTGPPQDWREKDQRLLTWSL